MISTFEEEYHEAEGVEKALFAVAIAIDRVASQLQDLGKNDAEMLSQAVRDGFEMLSVAVDSTAGFNKLADAVLEISGQMAMAQDQA